MSEPTAPERHADYYDFDAWYAENVAATIPFRLLGKVWDLPGDVDAGYLLMLQRFEHWVDATALAEALGDPPPPLPAGVTDDDLAALSYEGICRRLAGDATVDAWLADGIPAKLLKAVSRRLFAIHTGGQVDPAGKASTPAKKAKKKPSTRTGSPGA